MKRYDNISLLRVLAVFAIFLCHLFQKMGLSGWPGRIGGRFSLGVELFLVIGGFLAINHMDRPNYSVKDYYLKRMIRILPLYYFVIAYFFVTETFIFHSVPADPSGLGWWRYVFLLYGNIGSGTEWFNFWTNLGATWSICVFMTFYALMPILKKIIKNFSGAVIFTFIMWLFRAAFNYYHLSVLFTFRYFVFFGFGFIAYFAIKESKQTQFMMFVAASLAINIFVQGTIFEFDELIWTAFISAIAVITTIDWTIKSAKLRKVISIVDKYSYTVYLGQGIVFCGIIDKTHFSTPIVFAVSVIGTVLLSWLIYNGVEKPIQKFLSKRLLSSH